ncbi:inactive tyrosine-protein kinase PRAG1 [Ambystoma mexicanum]|uniref:inactive tyrosine-protein kinase PRAG1 n=1 Tax=Ambystoma mexicanum TaxID=8296 RepID=UPI0037E8B02B
MHMAVSLKPGCLKMSVCSDFVEHVWKPGSCKNCFHPRGSHGLQQGPVEGRPGSSQALKQGLHGILRSKADNVHEDDGALTASPYSKPTIAVKPTMISSEVSDAWLETTMTPESIPQVSWRKASSNHSILKTDDVPRTFFDHFNGTETFARIAAGGSGPQHAPGYSTLGLHSPDKKTERSTSFGSAKMTTEIGGHGDKANFLCKEKLTTTRSGFTQETGLCRDARNRATTETTGYLCIQTKAGERVDLRDRNGCSTSCRRESGDYCQITNCSTGGPVSCKASSHEGGKGWGDCKSPTAGLSSPDSLASSRATVKAKKEETATVNCQRTHQRDRYFLDTLQNHAGVDGNKTTSLPQSASPLDISPYASSMESPLASPPEGNYYRLSGELEQHQCSNKERYEKSHGNSSHSTVADPMLLQKIEASKSEPIYAESTKRKKGLLGNTARAPVKTNGLSNSSCTKQAGESCTEGAPYRNPDSNTQVTAKITVMAAHTEEDNRTIYLSSPDSAVSVQWSCTSPVSGQDFGTLSPSFQWGDCSWEIKGLGQSESSRVCSSTTVNTHQPQGSPSIPPKISKSGQHSCEQSHALLENPPVATFCDIMKQDMASTSSSTRTSHVTTMSENSSPRSPQRSFPEEPGRVGFPLAAERRHKYYHAAWSKQGRIEEEEEEECLSSQTKARGSDLRSAGAFKSSSNLHSDNSPTVDRAGRMGMSKSASCPYEFIRDREVDDYPPQPPPPPPPPKKQPRHAAKHEQSSCEPEKRSPGSAGSVSPPQALKVVFTTSSTDSLNSDTRTFSDGGQSIEGIHSPASPQATEKRGPSLSLSVASNEDTVFSGSLQPPPLPQKKSVNRAASAPDNTLWGQSSPVHRVLSPTSPGMSTSQSESNVCHQEAGQFSCPSSPGDSQHLFSSSESLEKVCRCHGYRTEARSRPCLQSRSAHSLSSSQLNMASHGSSGSTLQLHHLLSNIDSKEGLYAKLGGLYAESLRRLVAKSEDYFMRDQKTELRFNENSWSLFKLTCNKSCCDSGDAIYYCATCAKDPDHTYAVKICKTDGSKTATYCSLSLPVHFNIQQDCGHFLATVPSSMSQSTKPQNASSAPSSAPAAHTSNEQECVVVITREVPHQTAADLVKDSVSSHSTQPDVYERKVCFLLLQLCNGLEHLKEHGIIHRDLCLENLLLARCQPSVAGKNSNDEKRLPRLIVSNFSKAKQRSGINNPKLKRDQARLAPEIVSASQYKKFDEFQTGILIYELLHQPNPFEVRAHLREQEYSQEDLPSIPKLSLYSAGLERLAHLLLEADPIKRIRITEAKRALQCLLWGPRKDLAERPFTHEEALHGALQNWIDMKRALLMMKFAERAVDPERGIELEDWLCCQYLASTDPCFLIHTLRLLHLL